MNHKVALHGVMEQAIQQGYHTQAVVIKDALEEMTRLEHEVDSLKKEQVVKEEKKAKK